MCVWVSISLHLRSQAAPSNRRRRALSESDEDDEPMQRRLDPELTAGTLESDGEANGGGAADDED